MNAPGQMHALKHMFIPQKAHIDICSIPPTPTLTCPLHLSIIQSVISGVNHLADQPSRRAAGVNTGPPAALQHELLTPAKMHLASLQPSFSLPAFTFLPLFTTPAFMDSKRSITQSSLCTISPPPSLFRPVSNYSWYLA